MTSFLFGLYAGVMVGFCLAALMRANGRDYDDEDTPE